MADSDPYGKKGKPKHKSFFGFGKKKKRKAPEQDIANCPICIQKGMAMSHSNFAMPTYEENERMAREAAHRSMPTYEENERLAREATLRSIQEESTLAIPDVHPAEMLPPPPVAHRQDPILCRCNRCRRERGEEEPLTVELLPMDAQVTLQNSILQSSLQDAGFMCAIL